MHAQKEITITRLHARCFAFAQKFKPTWFFWAVHPNTTEWLLFNCKKQVVWMWLIKPSYLFSLRAFLINQAQTIPFTLQVYITLPSFLQTKQKCSPETIWCSNQSESFTRWTLPSLTQTIQPSSLLQPKYRQSRWKWVRLCWRFPAISNTIQQYCSW